MINRLHLSTEPSKMFTGLVECVGSIKSIVPTTEFAGFSFTIAEAKSILTDCAIGDSIAVSGVCLTVTAFDLTEGTFVVGLANETLARSNLGEC
jgi:riboflavin synthase